jgi:hypothetical protein
MPYVDPAVRPYLDELVVGMNEHNIKADGDLNYVLYAFCKRYVPRSYQTLRNYVAELRACATEIERTILGPYEDEKIIENGSVD